MTPKDFKMIGQLSSGKSMIGAQAIGRSLREANKTSIIIDIESFDINSMYGTMMRPNFHSRSQKRIRDNQTPWWRRVLP